MNRLHEWMEFYAIVSNHVKNYTIPQYGDAPNDNLQTWSVEDCLRAIDKYVRRNQRVNARGRKEAMRDMVKIAHFACVAFWKMFATIQEEPYITDIEEGR